MAVNLKEAVDIIQAGDWCALTFITADVKKGTGGKVIDIAKCRIARRRQTETSRPGVILIQSKDPNHNFHFTRNMELPNKMIRKVHPILITHINNQPVI